MHKLVIVVFILIISGFARAQSCPSENGGEAKEASVLHGKLVHHDELRTWLGLKLDHAACGETEIQLVFGESKEWRQADAFRGCEVTVTGELYEGMTGYYSANLAISEPHMKPDATCHPFPVKPDLAQLSVPPDLRSYHAEIVVTYANKGRIDVSVWEKDKSKRLIPWQAYVHDSLTGGGDVMWVGCAQGFRITDLAQTPKEASAAVESENVQVTLDDAAKRNVVTFTCRRE